MNGGLANLRGYELIAHTSCNTKFTYRNRFGMLLNYFPDTDEFQLYCSSCGGKITSKLHSNFCDSQQFNYIEGKMKNFICEGEKNEDI